MSDRAAAVPRTAEEVEALNDRLAQEHPIDAYYGDSLFVVRWIEQRRLEIIREMVAATPGMKVMEVGSGGGHVLRMFKQAKLTAVDVSEVFLDTAKKNLRGYEVEFLKGQVETLGLPEKSFDRIICTEVLEHTTDPEVVLREIQRLLNPDGYAVITVPVDPLIDGLKKFVRITPVGILLRKRLNWGGDHYHFHKWWPWQFERVLRRYFDVVEKDAAPFSLLPMRACFKCRAL
jgi:ubiquinone/menaquinone biosynthesis C-methylase UbiE